MSSLYPEGRYRVRFTAQGWRENKNGNNEFVWTFVPIGKFDISRPGGELVQCHDEERRLFRVVKDTTIDYFLEDLAALGFAGRSFAELDPETPGHHSFVGQEADMICIHEEYEGKTRERWSLAKARPAEKSLGRDSIRKLDALFGAKLKANAAPKKATTHAADATRREIEEAQEDAVPF